jgi:hypothetical protein
VSRAAHAASAASRGGRVVAAAVDDAVDEQGWRAQHLARGHAAVHIPADPLRPAVLARSRSNAATSRPSWAAYPRRSPSSSAFWRWNSSSCMSQNPSCRAGPRPLWRRRGRAGGCRSGGNGGTRTAQSRRAAVRPARSHGRPAASTGTRNRRTRGSHGRRANRGRDRLSHPAAPGPAGGRPVLRRRSRVTTSGGYGADPAGSAVWKPTRRRMRTMWMRQGSSWWISRIFPTWLCCP